MVPPSVQLPAPLFVNIFTWPVLSPLTVWMDLGDPIAKVPPSFDREILAPK